jgi:hypothetical protein
MRIDTGARCSGLGARDSGSRLGAFGWGLGPDTRGACGAREAKRAAVEPREYLGIRTVPQRLPEPGLPRPERRHK